MKTFKRILWLMFTAVVITVIGYFIYTGYQI